MIIAIENRGAVLQHRYPTSEQEFFESLTRVANSLFSTYTLHPWSPMVRDRRFQRAKPDAVLVRNDMREWFVIEVELAHHTLNHIESQLMVLADGIYDFELAGSLSGACSISVESARSLLRHPPQFLCVLNEEREPIRRICRETGFELLVVQPFVSLGNDSALLATSVPRFLLQSLPSVYGLRKSRVFGNAVFFDVPSNFPLPMGSLTVLTPTGDRIICSLNGKSLIVPSVRVRSGYGYALRIVDLSGRIVRLEEERNE